MLLLPLVKRGGAVSGHVYLDTGIFEGTAKRTGIKTRLTLFAETEMSAGQKENRNIIAPANPAGALFMKLPVLFECSGMCIIHVTMMR